MPTCTASDEFGFAKLLHESIHINTDRNMMCGHWAKFVVHLVWNVSSYTQPGPLLTSWLSFGMKVMLMLMGHLRSGLPWKPPLTLNDHRPAWLQLKDQRWNPLSAEENSNKYLTSSPQWKKVACHSLMCIYHQ